MSVPPTPPLTPQPQIWCSIEEAAHVCRRSPKTIRNLLYRLELPRARLWIVRNRQRRRVVFLSPQTVAYLQRATLYGGKPR